MKKRILLLGAGLIALAGCDAGEGNPLLFSQAITLGVSASPSAATPGGADFAVGFKQGNIAVVPTIVPEDVTLDNEDRKINSLGRDSDQGQTAGESDALSVFGSFSSKVETNKTGIGVFFSTGVAAQKLAEAYKCGTDENGFKGCNSKESE